ncbi:hypothetical protein AN217_04975 [Streptomyces qinglanensis]|uniref:DUF4865 domain-containing protein n=1 Tax=Streptomyces qinglanensis TaxID=943816 RepID=A0A1E7K095_9ACTN|nr:DUF4865 family protein [Streptomyces qinglanensis]OEU97332.1 hypothetical protein AN217_04975 [Streptomyces qinglanensis]OEV25853.1 hypothetical protein AN220_11465 [Streptomyces nanshensis]
MYAKQYEVTLPADYDMGIIRKRVADFGHILDDRAGLALKAYVIRERGADGSPVNQYAPFYLWNDTCAMSNFLVGGGGFQGIIRDFGRPAVHHWTGIASQTGPARGATPKAASRRLTDITVDSDPTGMGITNLIQNEIDELQDLAQRDGVHTAALAVDPRHWQLMRFILWEHAVPEAEDATERYEVLHLSTPHLSDLSEGRHW